MKQSRNKTEKMVKVSEATLLSLVASQIKGKILFPEKMEQGQKILTRAKFIKK
jgi:hypothetical protein